MREFRYAAATDPAAAVALLAGEPSGAFLGGGTNLVDLMKLGVATPDVLVDVRTLTSREVTDAADGGLRIGAGVPNADLAADRRVRERYPVLAQALLAAASGQLRNRATTAGNLLQRTRCGYFTDVTRPCNKRSPGSGCGALRGLHRNHAVLGQTLDGPGTCVATQPSDMAVAMVALDAVVQVLGPDGARSIPIGELHRLPGDDASRDTTLRHGELVTAVDLPPMDMPSRYRKVRDRASFAFALVSVAAALRVEDGVVADVRLALGGVAHKPWRAAVAEGALRGRPATEESFAAAADAELAAATPLPGNGYKVPLARNVVVRTLLELTGGLA
ncbi:FAD binding domain-containing protein [Geodermatophilus sabuli]|uniref:Xanthine dehydrogenase YagS FAD-binding subunit n=1 Tax=Geodermatophilus sabuli TaxID=1564158 RepID=A0A285E5L0_9ACTN|nr:xanthine dehydrogenase family protein subunit M [Geodermatophilus sabuli]MBB3082875.1 xanthine dehydrogenase YagS FAD-binding subunit [Geodermatophilus sabuli]SNX94260.1 xanthine dehydrogenase YagS FAD-binding subunit [Geodermatophilus sabuli]